MTQPYVLVHGVRVYPDLSREDHFPLLCPGEYRKHGDTWYAHPPWQHGGANLGGHDVVENADGTITVKPSIRVTSGNHVWHGYLEAGVWRTV